MYQMKRSIDMEQSPLSMFLPLSSWFVFSQIANEYSINHFCIMIKDLSISFSRVIIVQDFKTVTVIDYLYTSRPSLLYFLLNEKGASFKSAQ